jgi:hypothetical protein
VGCSLIERERKKKSKKKSSSSPYWTYLGMKRKLESQKEERSAMGEEIHLPVDVVGKILEFLPFDLLSARLVSKTWCKACARAFAPRGLHYTKMLEAPLETVATTEEKGMALFDELAELEEAVKERKLAVGREVMEAMKRSGVSTKERWARYCDIYKGGPITHGFSISNQKAYQI